MSDCVSCGSPTLHRKCRERRRSEALVETSRDREEFPECPSCGGPTSGEGVERCRCREGRLEADGGEPVVSGHVRDRWLDRSDAPSLEPAILRDRGVRVPAEEFGIDEARYLPAADVIVITPLGSLGSGVLIIEIFSGRISEALAGVISSIGPIAGIAAVGIAVWWAYNQIRGRPVVINQ
jgi:hypothetical protein